MSHIQKNTEQIIWTVYTIIHQCILWCAWMSANTAEIQQVWICKLLSRLHIVWPIKIFLAFYMQLQIDRWSCPALWFMTDNIHSLKNENPNIYPNNMTWNSLRQCINAIKMKTNTNTFLYDAIKMNSALKIVIFFPRKSSMPLGNA